MVILLAIILSIAVTSDVFAQGQTVTVNVLIEESHFHDCHCSLCFCDPKIYWEVTIDGVLQSSENDPIVTNVAPFVANQPFSQENVDVSKQNIPIIIAEYDKSCFPSSDSLCNLKEGAGRRLYLNLDLASCQISGDATGVCNTSITTMAGSFKFKIGVEEPPRASGMTIRCLHQPIWPQQGEQVAIIAEALDGNANPMTGIVDDIQIWVNSPPTAAVTTATTPGRFGANAFVFYHRPDPGVDQMLYRCLVREGDDWVSTGWRIVQIGQPAQGRAVPIIYTWSSDRRSDIVFIADQNDYPGGPNDPQFLTDVRRAIYDSYYAGMNDLRGGGRLYLFNQDAMNFWIALDTGQAVSSGTGDHVRPAGWDTEYSFADSGAIVHTKPWPFRDFADHNNRIFSSNHSAIGTFLHEAGHQPVGLADEYCCDGGYFLADFYPNIYPSQPDCLNDPLAFTPNPCQQIRDSITGATVDWFRVEDAVTLGNDLMESSGGFTANPADALHINTYFDLCRDGGC
jgi:hypothetical protein